MKEMFWPFLNIPPKSQEIKNTRMHINNSIWRIVIVQKMINFPHNIILNILPVISIVSLSIKVE